jgi:hypothetical protein
VPVTQSDLFLVSISILVGGTHSHDNLPAAVSTELARNRVPRRRVGVCVVLEHLLRIADGDVCLLKHVDDAAKAAT